MSCMSIWVFACDRDMITLNKFLYLYCLRPSIHHGYFELLPWDRKSRVVSGFLSSFCDWKSRYFFISGTSWETVFDDFQGEVPRLLTTSGGKSQDYCGNGKSLHLVRTFIIFLDSSLSNYCSYNTAYLLIFVVSNRPKLESQYRERVHATLAFALEIEDFGDLVDPRHLFDYCLGPEPSKYVLEKIRQEEKSKFILATLKVSLSLWTSSLFLMVTYSLLFLSRDGHQIQ